MGRRGRKVQKNNNFKKREVKEEEISPFSSIVLKEKAEARKEERREKTGSEIVGGYDPDASFADILNAYEKTGNPYALKKAKAVEEPTDFASIFEKWENRGKKKEVKDAPKSTYKATKSFATILAQFEGEELPEREEKKEEETPQKTEKTAITEDKLKEEVKIESEHLFKTPEDDEVRNPNASWSIYGNNESFVRTEKKEEEKEVDVREDNTEKSTYTPEKDFSEILDSFYSPKKSDEGKRGGKKVKSERPPQKTFEEMLKEKGDEGEKKVEYTISKLRTMLPQSTLDLHGMTREEGRKAVDDFFSECMSNGIRKVSIITGKGLHSEEGVSVIREMVDEYLSSSPLVSEKSKAPINYGGSGAYWVILKKKND